MKQMTKTLLLMLVLLIGATACGKDEPDDKSAQMEWQEPAGITRVDGIYVIPASGGTYKFTCKNYKPWIEQIVDYYELTSVAQGVSFYQGSWYSVNCDGNDVTFSFRQLMGEDDSHDIMVTLTAGNISDRFRFVQHP